MQKFFEPAMDFIMERFWDLVFKFENKDAQMKKFGVRCCGLKNHDLNDCEANWKGFENWLRFDLVQETRSEEV
jgi:hypothetical protein